MEASTGTYYELSEGSDIFIQNNTKTGVLMRGNIENIENDCAPCYASTIDEVLSNTDKNQASVWMLYDSSNDNQILAYCKNNISYSCNDWMIWNDVDQVYIGDSSFDVDDNTCDVPIDIDYNNFEDNLCFRLNVNNTEKNEIIYSTAQYLFGEYHKLKNSTLFNERPIYQNIRLKGTEFETYLLWYDPRDSWIFFTDSSFVTNSTNDNVILDRFEDFNHLYLWNNTKVITAWCDLYQDEDLNKESTLPQDCITWHLADNLVKNKSVIGLIEMDIDNNQCGTNGNGIIGINISIETEDINDLCIAFYDQSIDSNCRLPNEANADLTSTKEECQIPDHFQQDDYCNTTKLDGGKCETIDGNGLYQQIDDSLTISSRSYWRRIGAAVDDNIDERIYFYVYYNEYLRIWVSTNDIVVDDQDDNSTLFGLLTFEDLSDLGIEAFCLKWDLNAPCITDPTSVDNFYYYDDDNQEISIAKANVFNCDLDSAGSIDYAGQISGWLIVSCCALACCVFCVGFYKEYMERRIKKRGSRQSILSQSDINNNNGTQIAMTSSINMSSQQTIKEEENEQEQDDKETELLNPAILQSTSNSTDAVNYNE